MLKRTSHAPQEKKLRIALVADDLTRQCLELEGDVRNLTPLNYRWVLGRWKPDFLLVESVWEGFKGAWKFKVAAYPDHPKRSNRTLKALVAAARHRGIPTVFWNKEDGVHFDRFSQSAILFDHIFTVDENCIPRYAQIAEPGTTINSLMFAVQSAWHNFTGFNFRYNSANFVGSYSHHIHSARRQWQNILFDAAGQSGLGLTVFDRNSHRKSENYRYPGYPQMEVKPAVRYADTATIYKTYLASLNVNTIEDSPTMFSRRLIEIVACGGIAVTTPSLAVSNHFQGYCHVVSNMEEACELFDRLRHGPSPHDLQMAEAGAQFVLGQHTWAHRLDEIVQAIGLDR